MMDSARVTIVGAGPAGLVLGLALSQQRVKSLILERSVDIEQDPRGVYLAADAVRILVALGLEKHLPVIGHELHEVQFHQSSFARLPFHSIDLVHDRLQQAVPNGILQIQPELEKALRTEVDASSYCELRLGCEVQQIRETKDGVALEYTDREGNAKWLQSAWLIGADGKRGVVRKKFLEKAANIKQVDAAYRYEGTWIATNLKINIPTPETHPDFPLWQAGLTPNEVYDIFWPKGWHFCSPPGKPTAAGRFGPHDARLWRHEFRQDDWNSDTMDAEALFWDHITPMITKSSPDLKIQLLHQGLVTYPRDCIEVLRCRPFTFSHKVVNRWFWRRNVVIGDAAHVFPPFGGQGIAGGIRDAHQLAWRITLTENLPRVSDATRDRILDAWSKERTVSVADAAALTRINGLLCNNNVAVVVQAAGWIEWLIKATWSKDYVYDPQVNSEKIGFSRVSGGCFLPNYSGGQRMPQLYVDTLSEKRLLSDKVIVARGSVMRLLVLVAGQGDRHNKISDVRLELRNANIPKELVSTASIGIMSVEPVLPEALGHFSDMHPDKAAPTPIARLQHNKTKAGYSVSAMRERLGPNARYVLVRPDFYVFAVAKNLVELRACLRALRTKYE